jgi:hypothetical protein
MQTAANQDRDLTLLRGKGMEPFELLDGADPANKERRNELFGISGIRGKADIRFLVIGVGVVDWR